MLLMIMTLREQSWWCQQLLAAYSTRLLTTLSLVPLKWSAFSIDKWSAFRM